MARTPKSPAAACLAIVAVALSQSACDQSDEASDERGPTAAAPAAGLTTHRDRDRGYEVTFPSSWHRARENLTPGLIDPREILTIATFPLRLRSSDRCYPPIDAPVPALDRLGPHDALVSVQERIELDHRVPDDRPRRFSLRPLDLHFGDGGRRCARRSLGQASFFGFTDQGRRFHAFVALGRAASPRTRRAARRALDSLVFHPERHPGSGRQPQRRGGPPESALPLSRKPYLGVACPQPNRFACDRVGLTVWLQRPAEQVVAVIGAHGLALSDGGPPARRGRVFEGFLRPAGLVDGPLRITARPGTQRWEGDPPVYATVRIVATRRDGATATRTLKLRLAPGYG